MKRNIFLSVAMIATIIYMLLIVGCNEPTCEGGDECDKVDADSCGGCHSHSLKYSNSLCGPTVNCGMVTDSFGKPYCGAKLTSDPNGAPNPSMDSCCFTCSDPS